MDINVSKVAPYAKALVAVAGAIVVIATTLIDGTLSQADIVTDVAALVTAYKVFSTPNAKPPVDTSQL